MASADRDALLALFRDTGGASWGRNLNWDTASKLSTWYGVEVNGDGRVVKLKLPMNNLEGSIPPRLGNLQKLQELDLGGNKLSGPIPEELGALSKLDQLRLNDNSLSGPIPPRLGAISALEVLNLSWNQLSGSVPAQLLQLNRLQLLELSFNELTGPVPSAKQLRDLYNALVTQSHWHEGSRPAREVAVVPQSNASARRATSETPATNTFPSSKRGRGSTTAPAPTSCDLADELGTTSGVTKQARPHLIPGAATMEGNISTGMAAVSDFEGDVVAWSFGEGAEVLVGPEVELRVPRLGRSIPSMVGLCSNASYQVVEGKPHLLYPVVTCLARYGETFDPPLRLRFRVGDVDHMESSFGCAFHDNAEVAYRVFLRAKFSVVTREHANSEWVPIDGAILHARGGVFVLEVALSHFCDFALKRDNTQPKTGRADLVSLPTFGAREGEV